MEQLHQTSDTGAKAPKYMWYRPSTNNNVLAMESRELGQKLTDCGQLQTVTGIGKCGASQLQIFQNNAKLPGYWVKAAAKASRRFNIPGQLRPYLGVETHFAVIHLIRRMGTNQLV